jgi:hypothetical protein
VVPKAAAIEHDGSDALFLGALGDLRADGLGSLDATLGVEILFN